MPLLYLVLDFVKRNWFPILLALVIISGFLYVHNLQETIEDQELKDACQAALMFVH